MFGYLDVLVDVVRIQRDESRVRVFDADVFLVVPLQFAAVVNVVLHLLLRIHHVLEVVLLQSSGVISIGFFPAESAAPCAFVHVGHHVGDLLGFTFR